MFGCYRKDDAADPETYAAAVSAVLAQYESDIVASVTDPRSGLPSRMQWLPSVKEVRDACQEIAGRRDRLNEAARREVQQIQERKLDAEKVKSKPALADLKAKYGPNYGLTVLADNSDESRKKQLGKIAAAGLRLFRRNARMPGSILPVAYRHRS